MSKSVDIFFPLYVGDYQKKTQMLSCEEHGAYLLLIMALWQHNGKLPNDHKKLSRVCKLSQNEFDVVWEEIGQYFKINSEGLIENKRVNEELEKAYERKKIAQENGKKGGRPPKEKPSGLSDENPAGNPAGYPEQNPNDNLEETSSPSPSPSPTYSNTKNNNNELFEKWWDTYNKKVDRKKVERKWASLKNDEIEKCLAVVGDYVKWKTDPQYRKNPLTYLNGDCWNDEIPKALAIDPNRPNILPRKSEVLGR